MNRNSRSILFLITLLNILLAITVVYSRRGAGMPRLLDAVPSASAKQTDSPSAHRRTPIVNVAEKISPAVVSIGAERTTYVRQFDPWESFFTPYIVYPYKQRLPYLGSGVIIDPRGYVITNYHVIEGAEKVLVSLMDGREVEADIMDADKVVDIAMLKIREEGKYPFAPLGDSDQILIGEPVVAIGNPFGKFIEDPHPTVTAGVISALNRSFNPDPNNLRVYTDMIQTDASINPGNSGGPLVNLDGEIIGINTFIMTGSGASHGIGFAIPVNRVSAITREITTYGRIRPLWRDFDCVNLTPHLMQILKAPDRQGVVVRRMERGGPAEKCGIAVGDIIRRANNRDVRSCADLVAYFSALQVGDTFKLEVLRDGKTLSLNYIVSEYKQ